MARKLKRTTLAWGVKWSSRNRLDGHVEYLMGAGRIPPFLFKTRNAARAYVANEFDYIAHRPDLKAEPHGWKVPSVVRVKVSVEPA